MRQELWKDIPGFKNVYQASTHGRIKRISKGPSTKPGKILQPQKHHSGYLQICLCLDGIQYKGISIHKLVLITFSKSRPSGYQCRHLDGDKQNNHLSNLVWGTPKENGEDKRIHGRYIGVRGSANNLSKLTEKQVFEIKLLLGETDKHKHNPKISLKKISQKYGVSIAAISDIKNRKTWKHMEMKNG